MYYVFSEPGFPHAWPIEYQLTTDSPIKGIGAFGNSLLVTTEKNPYYVTGIHPGSVTMTKLELNQSCVSKDSVVDMGDTVMYASPDGLIAVGTNGVRKVTDKIFNREEWQKLTPSSIKAFYWEDMYIGFYDTGTTSGGFAVSPNKIDSGVIFFDTFATAGYSDLEEDILYLVTGSANTVLLGSIDATASTAVVGIGTAFTTELAVDDYILVSGETRKVTNIADDTNLTVDVAFTDTANDISPEKVNTHIVSWDTDASNPFSYTWASKPFITPVQTNFGVLQILADAYPISFRLVADGIVVRDGTANSEAPEFLPSGYLARNHEIEITGSTPVHQVIMANTMSELLKV